MRERSCGEETCRATRFTKSVVQTGDCSRAHLSRPALKADRRKLAVVTELSECGELWRAASQPDSAFKEITSPTPIHKAEEAESLTKWTVDYQPCSSVKVDECLPLWSFRKECRSFCFRVLRVPSSTLLSEGDLNLFAWRSAESTEVRQDFSSIRCWMQDSRWGTSVVVCNHTSILFTNIFILW